MRMEFRDFCRIFIRYRRVFLGVLAGCMLLSLLVLRFQPMRFEQSLTLNVTRTGSQKTDDYTYDQFYRLQADERFADTVVRWLGAPSVRSEIREAAGVSVSVTDSLEAKRLSSQMIAVTYRARERDGFGSMSTAVPDVLNRETRRLNEQPDAEDWFAVLADAPVVRDARLPARLLLPLGIGLGLFFGFFATLLVWYFRGDGNDR